MHEVEETRKYPKHSTTVTIGGTFPDGNFGNLRGEVSMTVEGMPGDSPSQTYDKVFKLVEKRFGELAKQLQDANG